MAKYFTLKSFLAGACVAVAGAASASVPLDYYKSINGLSGSALKNAIHELISEDVYVLSYGKGSGSTWWGFYLTDRCPDNSVRDRYSNETFYFSSQGKSVSGMNIEHSFPKSWWGGNENNAYKDLYNLMPCEAGINSSKSNYAMGRVVTASTDNGCTKVGKGSDGKTYWEPADKWKGDFARGYMYMATAYQDLTWTGANPLIILEQNTYPTLKKSASDLFIKWALADDIDAIEMERNDAVYKIQSNRNPFVDFPNLMCYLWGDSINEPFNIYTTRKLGDIVAGTNTIYDSSLTDDNGNCTPSGENASSIWTHSSQYGWKGSAYYGGARHNADCYLLTPELDLSGFDTVSMTFEHACNYAANPSAVLEVGVLDASGTFYAVNVDSWPTGSDWKYVPSGEVDLSEFCGQTVKVAFHYTSTTSESSTWELRNLRVVGSVKAAEQPEEPAAGGILYNGTFNGNDGDCTVENVSIPDELSYVWQLDSQYNCWKASAARGTSGNITNYATESYLVTPVISLRGIASATLAFEHACKFAAKPSNVLSVMVRDSRGTIYELDVKNWPSGSNWTFVKSGDIDLTEFCGDKIQIIFRYTSTTSEACTWEVKNVIVNATPSALVEATIADNNEAFAPEYFSIDGRRVNPATYRGVVVRRQGTSATKLILK